VQTINRSPQVVLRFDEIGQYVIVAPSFVAQLTPVIIVQSIASDVHHIVQHTGTAQHFTAWPMRSLQMTRHNILLHLDHIRRLQTHLIVQ
jgi:hypothetical protein